MFRTGSTINRASGACGCCHVASISAASLPDQFTLVRLSEKGALFKSYKLMHDSGVGSLGVAPRSGYDFESLAVSRGIGPNSVLD